MDTGRPLTEGEVALARQVFVDSLVYTQIRVFRRKWFPFQPRETVMAPTGNIHFHPLGSSYANDFSAENLALQGLFIHEMTHVWQHQCGRFLPIERHPFCRYDYRLEHGKPFARYGVEQQAEIVRHAFLLARGLCPTGATPGATLADYQALLPFG
ncbi:vgr related protein [Sphingomonas sp.]|uniref:vgr related protein n=1 Tax=Sphingomonas sp. TaxID=28214 RepID=UPI001D361344|nr:vgr related protein [Sphingomonas sp.]MBX9797809.1 vgr related protein [Sphingomonas sp.]